MRGKGERIGRKDARHKKEEEGKKYEKSGSKSEQNEQEMKKGKNKKEGTSFSHLRLLLSRLREFGAWL